MAKNKNKHKSDQDKINTDEVNNIEDTGTKNSEISEKVTADTPTLLPNNDNKGSTDDNKSEIEAEEKDENKDSREVKENRNKSYGKATSPFKIAFTLGAIAVITAFMLAALNSITAPVIQARREKEKAQAVAALFGGDMSDIIMANFEGELPSGVTEILLLNKTAGEFIGYCISTQPNGFGGKINMLVAVDADKKIIGVNILEMNETAGIGTLVKNDSFLSQFKGKSGDISVSDIDTISGATISSKAILSGVNAALNGIKDTAANKDLPQSSADESTDALTDEITTEAETTGEPLTGWTGEITTEFETTREPLTGSWTGTAETQTELEIPTETGGE